MFKIEYEEHGVDQEPIYSNDINTVADILIGIVNNESTEREAIDWCSKANYGSNFVNQKYRFMITCMYDRENVKPPKKGTHIKLTLALMELLIGRISHDTGLSYEYEKEKSLWKIGNYVQVYIVKEGYLVALVKDKKIRQKIEKEKGIPKEDLDIFLDRLIEEIEKVKRDTEEIKNLEIRTVEELRNKINILERDEIVRNLDIVEIVKTSKLLKIPISMRIYVTGCWVLHIEVKSGGYVQYRASRKAHGEREEYGYIFVIDNGTRCESNLPLTKTIIGKVLSSYNMLDKYNLI